MAVELIEGFVPGAIGRAVKMHGIFYARQWNMGTHFEALVARGLGAFAVRYDPTSDLVLFGMDGSRIIASMVVDLNDPDTDDRGSHLRFFILDDDARGTGIGKQMLQRAMDHVDAHCAGKCWLTTFAGLDAARHMYEQHGFVLTEELEGTRWGFPLTDQTFERYGPQKPR